jgi:hypothetical protein
MRERVEKDLATAEHLELDYGGDPNAIRARYQDGREVIFKDVQVHWPSLVRELYREGYWSRQKARRELRKYGEKL